MLSLSRLIFPGQIAEGTYNFTSTTEPSQIGGEYKDERVAVEVQSGYGNDDDLQILDEVVPAQRVNEGKFSSHNISHSVKSNNIYMI